MRRDDGRFVINLEIIAANLPDISGGIRAFGFPEYISGQERQITIMIHIAETSVNILAIPGLGVINCADAVIQSGVDQCKGANAVFIPQLHRFRRCIRIDCDGRITAENVIEALECLFPRMYYGFKRSRKGSFKG